MTSTGQCRLCTAANKVWDKITILLQVSESVIGIDFRFSSLVASNETNKTSEYPVISLCNIYIMNYHGKHSCLCKVWWLYGPQETEPLGSRSSVFGWSS